MSLRISSLSLAFPGSKEFFLSDISFSLSPGEILAIVGESGAGKTTLLNAIGGFLPIQKGEISLHEQVLSSNKVHLAPQDRGVGYIFQSQNLLPHLTIFENLVLGLTQEEKQRKREKIQELVGDLGLEKIQHYYPDEASGGQQQRAALGRCLLHEKQLLLFDEAFSNLDKNRSRNLALIICAFIRKYQYTAIFVTHQIDEAFFVADKIGIIQNGKLLQLDTIEHMFQQPRTTYVAQFLGPTNFLSGQKNKTYIDTNFGKVSIKNFPKTPAEKNTTITVLTHPNDYIIEKHTHSKDQIIAIQFLGMQKLISVQHENILITVLTSHEFDGKVGDHVYVNLVNSHTYVGYDSEGEMLQ